MLWMAREEDGGIDPEYSSCLHDGSSGHRSGSFDPKRLTFKPRYS